MYKLFEIWFNGFQSSAMQSILLVCIFIQLRINNHS